MAVNLAEIIILGLLANWVLMRLRIPGLIGMLLVGIVLGPYVLGWLDADTLSIGGDLRLIALIIILLRVGFELSRKTLHRVGGRVLLLAFIPATCEGVTVTLVGQHFLGLSLLESALLGSVLAAVSPAVVVPLMIRFIRERRGAQKDIPSMVMAAASVDDIYVIVVHSVLLGIYTGRQVNVVWQAAGVPLSLLTGALAGIVCGLILYHIFAHFDPRATKRVLVVIAVSIMLVRFQAYIADYIPFAGLVAAMAIGFAILERQEEMAHEISAKLGKIWVFAEIILFSLVGAQVNIDVALAAGIGGAAVLGLGLLGRGTGVMLSLWGSELSLRERVFVAVSYSPKATVQAAIGAAPLMAMTAAGMDTAPGEIILAVAVLSIVLTAPTGAWAIAALGQRFLSVDPDDRQLAKG